jgi:hypothetical protein
MFTRLLLVGALALLFAVTGRIKPVGWLLTWFLLRSGCYDPGNGRTDLGYFNGRYGNF